MKKSKLLRLLVFFIVIIIVVSFNLSGCKKTTTTETAAGETSAAETTSAETTAITTAKLDEFGQPILPEPEKAVTLDMWMQDWTAGLEIVGDIAALIKERHPNININIIPQPYETLNQKFIPAVMAGTEPDIMFGYYGWMTSVDVSELFLKLSPEVVNKEDVNKYVDSIAYLGVIGKSDGELYGVGWGDAGEAWGILVNSDLVKEANININEIKTWDALLTAAKKLTKYDGAGNVTRSGLGLTYSGSSAEIWYDSILQIGGKPFNTDTGEWDFNIPEAKTVTQFWADMVLKDKIDDPKIGLAYDNFPKGLCAMFMVGPWAVGAMNVDYPELNVDYILPPPVFPGGQPLYDVPSNAGWVFSTKLEDDKLKAVHIIARELMLNPKVDSIKLEKWAGAIQNKKLIEMLKSGEVVIEGKNVDLAKIIDEFITPFTKSMTLGSKVDRDYITNSVYYPEIEKIWGGTQSVDEALMNITNAANETESGVAE